MGAMTSNQILPTGPIVVSRNGFNSDGAEDCAAIHEAWVQEGGHPVTPNRTRCVKLIVYQAPRSANGEEMVASMAMADDETLKRIGA